MMCESCLFSRIVLCFFFFKQKTAYEMRISDWSSDVCSSDLPPRAVRGRLDLRAPPPAEGDSFHDRHRPRLLEPLRNVARRREQIGRASCRERVCQYV